ncbi:MAG: DUF192 domain-containing protein [Candidatus ainarchaeum sp.]|nr:DUF192 domain-containing protein [Candidatus ainarchaeum sp.]
MLTCNDKLIIKNVKYTKNSFQRMKGLMFEEEKKFNYALVFESETESIINSSVHMLFVFFPIDIVFLNKNKIVIDKARLTPFSLNYSPKKPAKYFIELPVGKAKNIKLKDKISW